MMAGTSPDLGDEFDKETLHRLGSLFTKYATPDNVVHVFHSYDINVLTHHDIQKVKAKAENKGDMEGATLLFSRLQHYKGWYPCLLNVLRDPEVKLTHVAEFMENTVESHRPAKIKRLDTLVMMGETPNNGGNQSADKTGKQANDLLHRLRRCRKNPGHTGFIPLLDFKIDHLPNQYQDIDVMDWIQSWADRTVYMRVNHISVHRPEYSEYSLDDESKPFPFYKFRGRSDVPIMGCGYVGSVTPYTENDGKSCECQECNEPGEELPKKVWGEIFIITASHVVYDNEESAHTTCFFNYDDDQSDLDNLFSLKGLKMWHSSLREDRSVLKYSTHDMELINKLDKVLDRCENLKRKVFYKLRDNKSNDDTSMVRPSVQDNFCIGISHPHGCSKRVSVGTWSDRKVIETGRFKLKNDKLYDGELTQYVYDTPTCPGSAGAPIISPHCREVYGELWHGLCHPHSAGYAGNTNISALNWEHVLPSSGFV